MTPDRFSREQRKLIVCATDEAQERTSRYYCIPPHHWQRLPYDLLTRQDHGWEPLPDEVLAGVHQVKAVTPARASSYDFYRIQLNDPGILTAAHRERLSSDLYPFLVFIITHELVHLVRLSSILDDVSRLPHSPQAEEERVQAISRQILSNTEYRSLEPVIEKFCRPHVAHAAIG